jgi:predicted nucleic acid-binding protein
MALYVDTSALLKRYLEEPDSATAEAYLLADPDWYTGRHTSVETRRNLHRALTAADLSRVRGLFEEDWRRTSVIELDEITCQLAAEIAELTGVRSLDALHLGAASRLGPASVQLLTFDVRQAQAARQLGFQVLGV